MPWDFVMRSYNPTDFSIGCTITGEYPSIQIKNENLLENQDLRFEFTFSSYIDEVDIKFVETNVNEGMIAYGVVEEVEEGQVVLQIPIVAQMLDSNPLDAFVQVTGTFLVPNEYLKTPATIFIGGGILTKEKEVILFKNDPPFTSSFYYKISSQFAAQ